MHTQFVHPNWALRLVISAFFILTLCSLLTGSAQSFAKPVPNFTMPEAVNSLTAAPVRIYGGEVTGMTLYGDRTYWVKACGGELYSPPTVIDSVPKTGGSPFVHYSENYSGCTPSTSYRDHVGSSNLAADNDYLYWITIGGQMLRASRSLTGSPALTWFVHRPFRTNPADPHYFFLSQDVANVWWTEGNQIYRADKSSDVSTAELVETYPIPVRKILPLDTTHLLLFSSYGDLVIRVSMDPVGWITIAHHVQAFKVTDDRIYWSEKIGNHYTILSKRRSDLHDVTVHYESTSPGIPYVDSLEADSSYIYWHERRSAGQTGFIYRAPIAGGAAQRLTDYLNVVTDLVSDGTRIIWTDNATGIYSL